MREKIKSDTSLLIMYYNMRKNMITHHYYVTMLVLPQTEDQCENLGLDLVQSKNEMYDCNEENTRLSDELKKVG